MIGPRQIKVLQFIQHYQNQKGYAPSYAEIANCIGTVSRASVCRHIQILKEAGYISQTKGLSRSLSVLKTPTIAGRATGVPKVGQLIEGKSIHSFPQVDTIDLHDFLVPGVHCFLLEVKESSAASCGIDHGDWVLVQAQHHAENGQWVVALIDGYESTLKRYYNNDEEGICLMDDQADKDPIILDAARVMIQGVLIAKIRKYASDAHKVKV
jgi:repressor LexA